MDFSFFSSPTVVVVFVVCAIAAVLGIAGSVLRAIAERDEQTINASKMKSQLPQTPQSAQMGSQTQPANNHQTSDALATPHGRRRPRLALAAQIAKGTATSVDAPQPQTIDSQPHSSAASATPAAQVAAPVATNAAAFPTQSTSGAQDHPTVPTPLGKPHTSRLSASPVVGSQDSDLVVPHAPAPKLAKILGPDLPQNASAADNLKFPVEDETTCDEPTRPVSIKRQTLHGHAARPHDLDQELPDPAPENSLGIGGDPAVDAPTRVLHLGSDQPRAKSLEAAGCANQTQNSSAKTDTTEAPDQELTVELPQVARDSARDLAAQAMKDAQTRAITLAQVASAETENQPADGVSDLSIPTTTGSVSVTSIATSGTSDLPGTIPVGSSDLKPRRVADADRVAERLVTAESFPAQKVDTASLPLSTRTIPLSSASLPGPQVQHGDGNLDTPEGHDRDQVEAAAPPPVAGLELAETDSLNFHRSYADVPPLEYRPDCPLSMPKQGQQSFIDLRDAADGQEAALPPDSFDRGHMVDADSDLLKPATELPEINESEPVKSRSQLRQRRIACLDAGVPDDAAWSRAPLQRDFEFAPLED